MTRRTITTDATGQREQSPEKAVVEATAVGEGESAAAARENARHLAATVRESLSESVTSPDRIQTTELEVADSSQAFDPDTDAPYRAVERIRIECAPESAAEAVVLATDADATVPSLRFGLREETRHRLEGAALDAAMDRAREKATQVAAAEGLAVGGVREVTTRDGGSGMSSIVDEALESSRDPDLHPTPVVVSRGVEVVYELTDE